MLGSTLVFDFYPHLWELDTLALIAAEIQKLTPSARIELFELDLTPRGGAVQRFHAGTNELYGSIIWQGNVYTPFPIQAGGFDKSTNGQLPRPSLVAANVNGAITAIILAYGDLTGLTVTRKRTLAKYLDAVNFPGNVNPSADPTAAYPDDVYTVEQRTREDKTVVELQLSSALDMEDVKIPRRMIIQNVCTWKYRSAECGYAGPPIANISDQYLQITDALTLVEKDFITARNALWDAQAATAAASAALAVAQNAYNQAIAPETFVLLNDAYNRSLPARNYVAVRAVDDQGQTATSYESAFYANAAVTLGNVYRKGTLNGSDRNMNYYSIQMWGSNSSLVASTTAALSTAQGNYNTAVSNQATAQATYDAALDALTLDPNFDNLSLVVNDVCGKRLSSCKLRFGENNELPFGGFPGAGLMQ